MTPLRIAILGAKHPHVFPRLQLAELHAERCRITGVYDSEARTLDHIAQTYGVPVHDDPEAALAGADAAIVEGYDPENPALVRLAAPRVRGILLEKPGAPTAAAMRELVAFCAQHPVHVRVGYMLQSSPIVPELQAILDSGVLGPITLARFHAATPVGCSDEIWQSIPEDEGGLLWTDGCHMMRQVVGLLGTPRRVTGSVRRLPAGRRVSADYFKPDLLAGLGGEHEHEIGTLVHEDVAAAVLDYEDKLAAFDITGWEAHGWVEQWRIELWGADGTLEAGLMPPWYRLHVRRDHAAFAAGVHERRIPGPGTAEVSLVPDAAYDREFGAFLSAVERGERDQSDLRAGLSVLETLHAIYESSRSGAPVDVPREGAGA